MKVLLYADVEKLGFFGDVVDVKDGFARNYLLPSGLAVLPSESNVKAIEEARARKAEERRLAHEQMVTAAKKVDGAEVTLSERANEQGHLFGSVTEEHIAEALRQAGFEVQARQVRLESHLRQVGDYPVTLRYAENITVAVTVHIAPITDGSDESEKSSQSAGE
ncbi:MAG: 50S ribosomal protein L9 [Sedimentisphaerales bacterium]|nr:50S ribosomal protein L9 [Sedimentisphaerales bacterium]